jgi:HlyD family secretion protein
MTTPPPTPLATGLRLARTGAVRLLAVTRPRLRALLAWARAHPRTATVLVAALLVLGFATRLLLAPIDRALTVAVRRGTLNLRLTETGVLRPAQSITYRAPLAGRELEITFLAPEGIHVNEGDLILRLDTGELEAEVRRATQDLRQAQMDLQSSGIERQEAAAGLDSLEQGEKSLGLDEARVQLRVAEKKVERLRSEVEALKPLLTKGFITRDELERSSFELEQAEAEVQLARKKAEIYVERTYPHDRERARLTLAQKAAQEINVQQRVQEAAARLEELRGAYQRCTVYAERPGLIVYEEYLAANPRRKVRVGDRVTRSQGLITIPEVGHMVVESSVDEAVVHKLQPGLPATVRLDAYPDLTLTGKVGRVGTLARAAFDRPFEDKRFDLVIDVDPTQADLRPEMTARVDVLLGELADRLLLPVNAVFDHEGVMVAHVVHLWGLETRRLDLGENSDLFVEVRSGLSAGERVTLVEPAAGAEPAGGAPGGAAAASKQGGAARGVVLGQEKASGGPLGPR